MEGTLYLFDNFKENNKEYEVTLSFEFDFAIKLYIDEEKTLEMQLSKKR